MIEVPTATQLFALARGVNVRFGDHRCYYCGGACAEECVPASEHVKASFTSRDTVCGGDRVCDGCVAAMAEKAPVILPDGTIRENQKIRCYSWVITRNATIAATKAHRTWLARVLLDPSDPPFVVSLSDSGQKHLLYRAVVCRSQSRPTITLEGEQITYVPAHLLSRLQLCRDLCRVVGKKALTERMTFGQQMKIVAACGEQALEDWLSVKDEPLTRLAVWLTPSKKECEDDSENKTKTKRGRTAVNRRTDAGGVSAEAGRSA